MLTNGDGPAVDSAECEILDRGHGPGQDEIVDQGDINEGAILDDYDTGGSVFTTS
jgi:hypothetical protein